MRTECTFCHARFRVADEHNGKKATCPKCQAAFTIAPLDDAAGEIPLARPVPPPIPVRPMAESTVYQQPVALAYASPGQVGYVSPMPLAKLTIGFLAVAVLMGVVQLVSHVSIISAAGGLEDASAVFEDRAVLVQVLATAALFLAASLLQFVIFLCWKYRAYRNLRPLHARQIRQSPGWAVGWYFVPIAFLWKPYQAMIDIAEGSDPKALGMSAVSGASGMVSFWWAVLLFKRLGGLLLSPVLEASGSPLSDFYSDIIIMLGSMFLWGLTAVMVWKVSQMQEGRIAALSTPQPAWGQPTLGQSAFMPPGSSGGGFGP